MGHKSAGLAPAALLAALACGSEAAAQTGSDAAPVIGPPRLRGSKVDLSYCYPPGSAEIRKPVFKFTVGVDGRARNVKLLQSGGDPRLDETGDCIVRRLEFRPLLRGSQAVKSTVTWPIHVGPVAAGPET